MGLKIKLFKLNKNSKKIYYQMKRKQNEKKEKNIQKKPADPIENILKLLELNENNEDLEKSKPKHMKEKEKITKVIGLQENNDLEEKEINPNKNFNVSDKREENTNKKIYEASKEDSEDLLKYLDELDDNKINTNDIIETIQTNSEVEEDIITNKDNKLLCNLKDLKKSENEENKNDTSYENQSGNKNRNDVEDTSLIGLADKGYIENLITNNQGSQIFLRESFKFKDVIGDGNCGYRAIANQLFGNENYHNIIRADVYDYLKLNSERFKELNFEVNGELIDSEKYIKKIKKSGFWMGDLEMSVINKIYDVNFYLFEERNNHIILLANWGNIYDNSKMFINICFVDNNHYNVLYE